MSAVRVTWRRTIGCVQNLSVTAFAIGGFLAAVAVTFAFGLESAEGGILSTSAVWAASVSPWLPVLAAFLAMDVWSDERQTGRVDLLLSVAVRERDYVVGKFMGVWTVVLFSVALCLASSLAFLWLYAPASLTGMRLVGFVPAFLILAVQSALWSSISVASSAVFFHSAAAACMSIILTVAIPRGVWFGLMAWSGSGRVALGEMPLDVHAIDVASGLVSTGPLICYVLLTVLMLFVASKTVVSFRFVGRGAASFRVSTAIVMCLAFVAAGLAVTLAVRLDRKVDLPGMERSFEFSQRTRSILAESAGKVSITCFLPRSDARFRSVGQFLRLLRQEAEASGGIRFDVRFVDPLWDLSAAERLVRRGVTEDCLIFERGRRLVALPLREGYGERLCASTIRNLMTPPQRRNIYWTIGHGENRFDEFGAFGMSDIARDVSQEGYRNLSIDLGDDKPVPSDCASIVIAGPRDDFSRSELGRLDAYLREGGRLLVLLDSVRTDGLVSLLSTWGVRPSNRPVKHAKTVTGEDVIVSRFFDHEISKPLRGSRIVLGRPVVFEPSATAEVGAGVDSVSYSPVAGEENAVVAAASERGTGVGGDLAMRPTRVVAVGDASFVQNGLLASRANANRDFFLNCIAYLSGTDSLGANGVESSRLVVGMDRTVRLRHLLASGVAFPAAVFLLLLGLVFKRRRLG